MPASTRPVIGIDVGGTKILAGIVSASADVLHSRRVPTRHSNLVSDIVALTLAMLDEADARGLSIAGIGVGMTGFVDRAQGRLIRSMNMRLEDLPVAQEVSLATSLPVHVDNDVQAATLGELHFGAGRQYRDFLLFNAGTGLATGMVFGGRLHRGASDAAGENGHMSVDQSGHTICSCGMSGDVEALLLRARAGGEAVPAYLPRVEPPPRSEYGYVALSLIQLVNLLNPPAIMLAGGMFFGNTAATEWVIRAVRAHALPAALRGLDVIALSSTAPLTGLVGAAALALGGEVAVGVGEA
jgi:glucokinase